MSDKPAVTPKKRGGKTSTSWKPGQSGNPKGGPKLGSSWVESIEAVGKMTPAEVVALLDGRGELARMYKQMPQNIPMKTLIVLRVNGAIMFEPTPGLFNAVMDRTEGKPKQPITGVESEPLKVIVEYAASELETETADDITETHQAAGV